MLLVSVRAVHRGLGINNPSDRLKQPLNIAMPLQLNLEKKVAVIAVRVLWFGEQS